MKPISKNAIKEYFDNTLRKPKVVEAIEKANSTGPKMLRDYTPTLHIDRNLKGFTQSVAGYAQGCSQVHIAEWILADESQAKGVVRHEVAHILQHYQNIRENWPLSNPHGKTFTSALKIVSPTSWRKDRHWLDNPHIEKARKECKAKPKKILLT